MSARALIVLTAIPFVVILVFLFVPYLSRQPWTPLRIAGAVIAIAGYSLVATARVQLGKSFAVTPQAKELVTHGFYSRIRNPMYVFVDVTIFGLILAVNLPWLLLFLVVWIGLQARQAGKEAEALQEKFGQTYLEYRKQTWF
ncbi:MAG TPA: isoprenylcysteine carboxylmethyltransferase family protein [Candidatus Acidoferrales bacterium]|nr:isoprenylcysteine carboxylmethyltransferase family protein [Candidatus Acidoferrales bacterium]